MSASSHQHQTKQQLRNDIQASSATNPTTMSNENNNELDVYIASMNQSNLNIQQ